MTRMYSTQYQTAEPEDVLHTSPTDANRSNLSNHVLKKLLQNASTLSIHNTISVQAGTAKATCASRAQPHQRMRRAIRSHTVSSQQCVTLLRFPKAVSVAAASRVWLIELSGSSCVRICPSWRRSPWPASLAMAGVARHGRRLAAACKAP